MIFVYCVILTHFLLTHSIRSSRLWERKTHSRKKKTKWNTYIILVFVQLTLNFVVQTFRPFSISGNSKSIKYAENSAEIVDSSNSKWLDLPCYSTWPTSKTLKTNAVYYSLMLYVVDDKRTRKTCDTVANILQILWQLR